MTAPDHAAVERHWQAGFGYGCLYATAIVNALWLIALELGWVV